MNLDEMLPRQNVIYTKCTILYTKMNLDKVLLYENVPYKVLLIQNKDQCKFRLKSYSLKVTPLYLCSICHLLMRLTVYSSPTMT